MMQSMEKKMSNINDFIEKDKKSRRRESSSSRRANNAGERGSSEQRVVTASSVVTRDEENSEDKNPRMEAFELNPQASASGEENDEQREILKEFGLPPRDSFGRNF